MIARNATFILLLFAACCVALLFAPDPASAASGRIAIESSGGPRTALFVEHRRLKQGRRPLVIVLRGEARSRGPRWRQMFGLEEMIRSAGPVLVYPDPVAGHWPGSPGLEASRDVVFIRDLIAKLVADGIADRRKIFLIGISGGGLMAIRLACEDASAFAGAAVVIASMPADLASTCKPSRPLPFMMIAGTADQLVPFNGGKTNLPDVKTEIASVSDTLAIFGKAAGCGEGLATTAFPDRDTRDGTRAYLDRLNGCKVPVELVRVEGGGHFIPGHGAEAEPGSGRGQRNGDIDSARVIWEFFRRLGG